MSLSSLPWQHVHPALANAAEFTIMTLTVAFTSADSLARPALLPLMIAIPFYTMPISYNQVVRSMWRNIFAAQAISFLIQYIDVALVTQWTFESNGPSRPNKNIGYANKKAALQEKRPMLDDTFWNRVNFGIGAAAGQRNNGTKFEVKGVPPFSAKDKNYVPSKSLFLKRTAGRLAICYLIMDVLLSSANPEDNVRLYSSSLVPLFARLDSVTAEQLAIRAITSIVTLSSIYLTINILRSIVALVTVSLDISEPSSWRPLYGTISEAYTIRHFWGTFWHQLNRQRLTSPAAWLTYDFLRFPKGSLSGRYLAMSLVFFVSGLMHAIPEVVSGMEWQQNGAIRYFIMQFFGIVLEDLVEAMFELVTTSERRRHLRSLGYIWVLFFQIWTVPGWVYPAIFNNKGQVEDEILPFSIISALQQRR